MKLWYLPTSAGGNGMYSTAPSPAELRERLRGVAFGGAHRVDRDDRDLVVGRRRAAAEIEDAASLRVVEELEVDLDDVVDRNEIASLLARGVACAALEEPHAALRAILVEEMHHDGCHASLVPLARAVDVEVAEAGDRRRAVGQQPPHVLVEQELGVAVDVERRLVRALLAEHAAAAVDRCARRVQERHVVALAPVEERHRVPVVVAHHVAAVGLHRVGARALVQDRADVVVEVAIREAQEEFLLVHVVGDLAVGEVPELVGLREVVDGDDVGLAAQVERADEIRADESGGSGDDGVHVAFFR